MVRGAYEKKPRGLSSGLFSFSYRSVGSKRVNADPWEDKAILRNILDRRKWKRGSVAIIMIEEEYPTQQSFIGKTPSKNVCSLVTKEY